MKNTILYLCLCSIMFGQTLDINALRNVQSAFSNSGEYSSSTTQNVQAKMQIKMDKPIDPKQYIIGPGDQFLVNIISSDQVANYTLSVSPTGEILIPSVGIISLSGESLNLAISKMESAIKSLNQSAQVFILLSEIREFKIKVVGHLQNPGLYTVTPVTRVSDLYQDIISEIDIEEDENDDEKINREFKDKYDYGNIIQQMNQKEKTAIVYPELSTRNLFLLRDKDTVKVDLAKFAATGIDQYNPFINQEDILVIPLKQNLVSIYGGVNISGKYEFVQGESLHDLIRIAGGIRPDADPTNIEITRFTSPTQKYSFQTSLAHATNIIIEPEDHIMLRYAHNYKRQDVAYVRGEILYPGVYTIEPGITTIGDILSKSGGYTDYADSSKMIISNDFIEEIPDKEKMRILFIPEENRSGAERAYIKARMLTQKGTLESNSINQTQSIADFKLLKNDIITIPENFSFVEVLGAVENPGRYAYYSHFLLSDYLELSGGLTKTATRGKFIIKSGTGQRLPFNKNIGIESGDAIFIAEKMEYNKWLVLKDTLTTLGQFATLVLVIQRVLEQ
jgi:polysaccharide export outer membrane protein